MTASKEFKVLNFLDKSNYSHENFCKFRIAYNAFNVYNAYNAYNVYNVFFENIFHAIT